MVNKNIASGAVGHLGVAVHKVVPIWPVAVMTHGAPVIRVILRSVVGRRNVVHLLHGPLDRGLHLAVERHGSPGDLAACRLAADGTVGAASRQLAWLS